MRLMRKELRLLSGELQTPPIGVAARREIGRLLRRVQNGLPVDMPHSRPMPDIGAHVHELRVNDEHQSWRVIYRIDSDAVVVAAVWSKKTPKTPPTVIEMCRKRYGKFDQGV